jgi:hypothetical protein
MKEEGKSLLERGDGHRLYSRNSLVGTRKQSMHAIRDAEKGRHDVKIMVRVGK